MELLESVGPRPRQARYQAALRPDMTCVFHSKAVSDSPVFRIGVRIPEGKWGGRWDLNPRHSEPQSDALPTELRPPERSVVYYQRAFGSLSRRNVKNWRGSLLFFDSFVLKQSEPCASA